MRITLDYDDLWRGREKEVRDLFLNTVESPVAFLTDAQKLLLERSPREFLTLDPMPEDVELLDFETERVGTSERVVAIRVTRMPEGRRHLRHVAIVPNLVPLQRQLHALKVLEERSDDGCLTPLRCLLGCDDPARLATRAPSDAPSPLPIFADERLDEFQRACVAHAMESPHFAVIQGPPGSGKTTVIASILRRAVARGERVLVVSSTHVAVDNVVEKITPGPDEASAPLVVQSLPVRFAARQRKLSPRALDYWVGAKKQRRGATIATRVQRCLSESVSIASALYAIEDAKSVGVAPLSTAVAACDDVLCGTPIGVLSYESVKLAAPGAFDLLVVDEVSKLTLAEFLAVAVKARRWVLVGDPEQLPPYNDIEENGVTLDGVLDARLELACSVGALVARCQPAERDSLRLVVAASDPASVAAVIAAHLAAVAARNESPLVVALADATEVRAGVIVCLPEEVEGAVQRLSRHEGASPASSRDRSAFVHLLVERGLAVPRPATLSGVRLVEARHRSPAQLFEASFNLFHALPWSRRSGHPLRLAAARVGLQRALPSAKALAALTHGPEPWCEAMREALVGHIALRFAVNTVSVYDWLTGMPAEHFDVAPLHKLSGLSRGALCEAVRPFVGTLKKQYRMHRSLSALPRAMFYFGEALLDARADSADSSGVMLVHVEPHAEDARESNRAEADAVERMIKLVSTHRASRGERASIMVLTPYRAQEALLKTRLEALDVEVCTLDRCQGREADYVFISLVRGRATAFLDMPKRWNVALTRARTGLVLVGDLDAYRAEAQRARSEARRRVGGVSPSHPTMSLLARIIEGYDALGQTMKRAS